MVDTSRRRVRGLERRRGLGRRRAWPALLRRIALAEHVLRDLERFTPELLVVNTSYMYAVIRTQPVSRWLADRYSHCEGGAERGQFRLFVRRGGQLEARLRSAADGG